MRHQYGAIQLFYLVSIYTSTLDKIMKFPIFGATGASGTTFSRVLRLLPACCSPYPLDKINRLVSLLVRCLIPGRSSGWLLWSTMAISPLQHVGGAAAIDDPAQQEPFFLGFAEQPLAKLFAGDGSAFRPKYAGDLVAGKPAEAADRFQGVEEVCLVLL